MNNLSSSMSAACVLAVLTLVPGCNSDSAPPQEPRGAPEATGAPGATARPEGPQAGAPADGPLVFVAQEGWIEEQPSSGMRAAQYRLPAAEGDEDDAELVVFFFGPGGGGGFEDNVERWAGQFEQPDGGSSLERVRHSSREVAGMPVRMIELEGDYVAETRPGSGQRVHEEGWALRAAVIDAPHGPYYVKLVGPEATVERWDASYRSFLGDARPSE